MWRMIVTVAVSGPPKIMLRIEALMILIGAATIYGLSDFGWGRFALLFLVPDLSMAGYLIGPRVGAIIYNTGHSHILPLICLAMGSMMDMAAATTIGLIWIAHIGFDRALGYGLKYPNGFGYTHLGLLGTANQEPPAAGNLTV